MRKIITKDHPKGVIDLDELHEDGPYSYGIYYVSNIV